MAKPLKKDEPIENTMVKLMLATIAACLVIFGLLLLVEYLFSDVPL